eukprot:XP_025014969.1 MADS-box transcription factor 6 [Ricinus communis]
MKHRGITHALKYLPYLFMDQIQNLYHEVTRLKTKYESLQCCQSHLLGEELGPLSVKELQKIEKQLDRTLSQARQRKTQLLVERMEELRKKEHDLGEENKQLKIKLEEGQCLEADVGGPVKTAANKQHPSKSNHSEQQMRYHQFIPQVQTFDARKVGRSDPAPGWLGWSFDS